MPSLSWSKTKTSPIYYVRTIIFCASRGTAVHVGLLLVLLLLLRLLLPLLLLLLLRICVFTTVNTIRALYVSEQDVVHFGTLLLTFQPKLTCRLQLPNNFFIGTEACL